MMITKNLFLVRFKGMILMNKLKQVSLSSTLSVPLKQQVSMCQYVSVCVYYVSVCVNFIENKAKCLWME